MILKKKQRKEIGECHKKCFALFISKLLSKVQQKQPSPAGQLHSVRPSLITSTDSTVSHVEQFPFTTGSVRQADIRGWSGLHALMGRIN